MVTCWRRKVKSILGRLASGAGLTEGVGGATVALAVVTTFCAGKSRLWPTASSLVETGLSVGGGSTGLSREFASVEVSDSVE